MSHLFGKLVNVKGSMYPSLFEYTDEEYADNEPAYYVPELAEARTAFITQLTQDQIVDVEVVDVWRDDHEACLAVDITFDNGDVLSVAAHCVCQEFVSNFYRPDEACKTEIIEYLQCYLVC